MPQGTESQSHILHGLSIQYTPLDSHWSTRKHSHITTGTLPSCWECQTHTTYEALKTCAAAWCHTGARRKVTHVGLGEECQGPTPLWWGRGDVDAKCVVVTRRRRNRVILLGVDWEGGWMYGKRWRLTRRMKGWMGQKEWELARIERNGWERREKCNRHDKKKRKILAAT